MNIQKRAYDVVNGFKASLTDEQKEALDDENFEELQILVEASIGANAAKILHDMAKKLEAEAHEIRMRASEIEEDND